MALIGGGMMPKLILIYLVAFFLTHTCFLATGNLVIGFISAVFGVFLTTVVIIFALESR